MVSSVFRKMEIFRFFENNNIKHDFFNQNLSVQNTKTGCFDEKFYFSVLLDDKAGFDPNTDWKLIYNYLINKK